MKKALLLLALLSTTALAARPDCAAFADKDRWYFDAKGNILVSFYMPAYSDDGLTSPATRQNFHRLAEAFKYHNSQLIVLPLPAPGWSFVGKIDPREAEGTIFAPLLNPGYLDKRLAINQQRLNLLRSTGLQVADFMGTALPALRANPDLVLFNPQDSHWMPEGARLGSLAVLAELAKLDPQLKTVLNTMRFDIKTGTSAYFKGNGFPYVVRTTCPNIKWTPFTEDYPTVQSVPLDEIGLLDDVETPPVVLLGSSYSASTLGFAPYLQMYLGAEVTNASQAGGATFGGIFNYFPLTEDQPWAKLYIWEFPDIATFPVIEFRQVLPRLLPSAEIEHGDFSAPGTTATYALKTNSVTGNQYAVEVAFDQPQTREILVDLIYADRTETVRLTKPRGDIPKQFFVELGGETPLKSIAAKFSEPVKGNVHLIVRKYDEAAYKAGMTGKGSF